MWANFGYLIGKLTERAKLLSSHTSRLSARPPNDGRKAFAINQPRLLVRQIDRAFQPGNSPDISDESLFLIQGGQGDFAAICELECATDRPSVNFTLVAFDDCLVSGHKLFHSLPAALR